MKKELREVFTNWKILLMIAFVIFAVFSVGFKTEREGVYVLNSYEPATEILPGDLIVNINGMEIKTIADYEDAVSKIIPGEYPSITVKRNVLLMSKEIVIYPFAAQEKRNKTYLGVTVSGVPISNLKFGLEIDGGTRLLIKPTVMLDANNFTNVIEILRQRLNIYGLKESPVTSLSDLSGNQYIQVELAGATREEAMGLLQNEGVFEAKIGNKTAFTGEQITSVCLSGVQCTQTVEPILIGNTASWKFAFQIDISLEAAQKFNDIVKELAVKDCYEKDCYLNETIDFFIDEELLSGGSLRISAELQKSVEQSAVITGTRETKKEAMNEMKRIQALLQSRKLPVELEIVKIETISPVLGKEFALNIFMVFVLAILFVDVVIFIRYKSFSIAVPIVIVTLSEIFITLGVAASIGWTLDLASIAGIIASVGVGVDDQIIITDEVRAGKEENETGGNISKKIKKAFAIILTVFSVTFAGMLPLLFAGAGLLRGFAITTLIGVTVGVLITRPAYGELIKIFWKKG